MCAPIRPGADPLRARRPGDPLLCECELVPASAVDAICAATDHAITELRVDGGASAMDVLCRFQADVLGVTVRRPVVQETTVLGVPCLTLRPNTERPVTITHGTNRLVTREGLASEVERALAVDRSTHRVPPLWDGAAGPRIAEVLLEAFA